MAKFGIALGSGPRGPGFESRCSDQIKNGCKKHPFFIWSEHQGIRKGGTSPQTGAKIESGRAIFSPWENPWLYERTRMGVGVKPYFLF